MSQVIQVQSVMNETGQMPYGQVSETIADAILDPPDTYVASSRVKRWKYEKEKIVILSCRYVLVIDEKLRGSISPDWGVSITGICIFWIIFILSTFSYFFWATVANDLVHPIGYPTRVSGLVYLLRVVIQAPNSSLYSSRFHNFCCSNIQYSSTYLLWPDWISVIKSLKYYNE
jgi:hypothetical protein